MRYSGISHIGMVRETNEDYYEVIDLGYPHKPIFFMLADGMGGHNAGEVASHKAIEYVSNYIKTMPEELFFEDDNKIIDSMEKILKQSNDELRQLARTSVEYEGMGTTFIFVCIYKDNIYICHIGDSRVYLLRQDSIICITVDHSYIEELIKLGQLTREEAKMHPQKNVITRAVGIDEVIEVDKHVHKLVSGDVIVLCTDGLNSELSDVEIFDIVKNNDNPEDACRLMVEKANTHGGEDNITVIIIKPDL